MQMMKRMRITSMQREIPSIAMLLILLLVMIMIKEREDLGELGEILIHL